VKKRVHQTCGELVEKGNGKVYVKECWTIIILEKMGNKSHLIVVNKIYNFLAVNEVSYNCMTQRNGWCHTEKH